MIYIDPSELRESSKLKKYISDVIYKPLPELEAMTGADLMISPTGLPPIQDEVMLQYHIDQGAILEQWKFGHDLPSSIADDRLNNSLMKMQSTGAQAWQCRLTFVGTFNSNDDEMALVDGEMTYTDYPMKWIQIDGALDFYILRGGSINPFLSSEKSIRDHLNNRQKHLDVIRAGEKTKLLWPKLPLFYNETPGVDPLVKEWYQAQNLKPIDDIRNMIRYIPATRIGPKMAMAIGKYMEENEIRLDWSGFTSLLQGDKPIILDVPGIGKKTLDNILWGLYRTKEERMNRK